MSESKAVLISVAETKDCSRQILDLGAALAEMSNYHELPELLYHFLNPILPIDWIAVFTFTSNPHGSPAYEFLTYNDSLAEGWWEMHVSLLAQDFFHQHLMSLPACTVVTATDAFDPQNESHLQFLELASKQMGAMQVMGGYPVKQADAICGVVVYRRDIQHLFSEEEKRLLQTLLPMLACTMKLFPIHLQSKFELQAAEDLLFEKDSSVLLLDHNLDPIFVPVGFREWLEPHFKSNWTEQIPSPILHWILRVVAPGRRLNVSAVPFFQHYSNSHGSVYLKATVLRGVLNQPILQIQVRVVVRIRDFSPLRKLGLTAREIDVLSCLPKGCTNRQIGEELGIKPVTVKKHLANISEKLDVQGKTEILSVALQLLRKV